MVDWLVYLMSGGFAGVILAFIIALFKVGPGKPEFNFGKCCAFCLLFTIGAPFAYIETQTRMHSGDIKVAIKKYFDDECTSAEEIDYIKILHATRTNAIGLIVGKDKESWGGYDRPVIRVYLSSHQKAGRTIWHVEKEDVLRSSRLNKDSLVWPPFQ